MNFGPFQKSVTAFVTGLVGWGFQVIASTPTAVTAAEWMALAAVSAAALGVYAVPNQASQAEVDAALKAFESVRGRPADPTDRADVA